MKGYFEKMMITKYMENDTFDKLPSPSEHMTYFMNDPMCKSMQDCCVTTTVPQFWNYWISASDFNNKLIEIDIPLINTVSDYIFVCDIFCIITRRY